MRTLIVEDDFVTRLLLTRIIHPYGQCDIAINGSEAIQAFKIAMSEKNPYNLILMDIMMQHMDGHEALKQIRAMEKSDGVNNSKEVKVIMVTALDDPQNVIKAYQEGGATGYIVKPIVKDKLLDSIRQLNLIE